MQTLSSMPPLTAPPLRPGVGVTVYGNLPRDLHPGIVESADFVTLHTAADATDISSAARVRQLGCARVWLALPANYFVRIARTKGVQAAVQESTRCARIALAMQVEVLEFNGEGSSDDSVPGDWIPATQAEAEHLADLAERILEAAEVVLRGVAHVMWTSHDMPGFKLPWGVILRHCTYSSPQHYPAEKGRTVKQRELESRVARSQGRWEALAERGVIPAEHVPHGTAWVPYFQGHGHTDGALVWALCEAPVTRLWAYPGSWHAAGLVAMRAARVLRAAAGFGPDAVERFQGAHDLVIDGVVGPKTMNALGRANTTGLRF